MSGLRDLSAWAGLSSPLVLALGVIAGAAQRDGYSHLKNTISELGAVGAPHATLVNWASIVPAGLLVAAATPAVVRRVGAGRWAAAGAAALTIGGFALAGTAMSPWRGDPTDLSTTGNQLHLAFAMVGFLAIACAPLGFGLQARRTRAPAWFAGSVGAAAGVFVLAFWPAGAEYRGLFQRLSLAVFFLWLVLAAISTRGRE